MGDTAVPATHRPDREPEYRGSRRRLQVHLAYRGSPTRRGAPVWDSFVRTAAAPAFLTRREAPELEDLPACHDSEWDPTGGLLRVKQKCRRMPAAKVGD